MKCEREIREYSCKLKSISTLCKIADNWFNLKEKNDV